MLFKNVNISIHAPVKGATTLATGGDEVLMEFQSTHPRRVRPCSWSSLLFQLQYFNPRTREGCDKSGHQTVCTLIGFQSTHPRRVRRI